MTWVATAAIVGGAVIGADASKKASSAQASAVEQGIGAQKAAYGTQVGLQQPFREAGVTGLNQLMYMLGLSSGDKEQEIYNQLVATANEEHRAKYGVGIDQIDPSVADNWKYQLRKQAREQAGAQGVPQDDQYGSLMRDFSQEDFEADPGYAFRLSEGMKALDRSAAARGGLQSGAALKAAARYGQDMASQEYQNAFNRYQINRANKLQPLQSLAGMAQTSANTLTGAAGNLGQGLSNSYADMGNARASGYMGTANAISGGLGQYLNYQQGQNYLAALKR